MTSLRLAFQCFGLLLLAAVPAGAATIYTEGFNTDGAGTRYTVVGGGVGGGGTDLWALHSTGVSFGFSGQEGADFFGGRDLDEPFGGGANPRSLTLPLTPQSLSGYTTVQLTLSLAAITGEWESADPDFVRIYARNATTSVDTLLDQFTPTAALNGNLRSATFPARTLGTAFADFTYDIPISIGDLSVRLEAYSTGDLERVGFDNARITGTPVPEPASALLLGLGLAGLAKARRVRGPR